MKKTKQISKPINLLAPFTVALIVITLGAAFGALSGRGVFIGMLSTCVITSITALIGGSKYGVSSPTGPMTAAIALILLQDQQWLESHQLNLSVVELMNLTLLIAAISLFIFTLLRFDKLIKWVPNLVIGGFVNGIAILITISQLQSINLPIDALVTLFTLALAMGLNYWNKKNKHPLIAIFASSLGTILIMTLVIYLLQIPVSFVSLKGFNESIQLSLPPIKSIDVKLLFLILPLGIELAFIGLLDTLLTSVILDRKSNTKTKTTRELSGQSIALFSASLFGGIPGAQSTVPSMMLYKEKGHHAVSKILLALFCIMFTFLFTPFIQWIPNAVLGGIILKIAFDVADFTSFKSIFNLKTKKKYLKLFVFLGTMLSTVFLSLNLAVIFFTLIFVIWNSIFPKEFHIPDLKTEKEMEGLIDEL